MFSDIWFKMLTRQELGNLWEKIDILKSPPQLAPLVAVE